MHNKISILAKKNRKQFANFRKKFVIYLFFWNFLYTYLGFLMNFKKFTFLSKSPAFSPTARQQFFPPADPQNRPKWAIPPASGHPVCECEEWNKDEFWNVWLNLAILHHKSQFAVFSYHQKVWSSNADLLNTESWVAKRSTRDGKILLAK